MIAKDTIIRQAWAHKNTTSSSFGSLHAMQYSNGSWLTISWCIGPSLCNKRPSCQGTNKCQIHRGWHRQLVAGGRRPGGIEKTGWAIACPRSDWKKVHGQLLKASCCFATPATSCRCHPSITHR